MPRPDAILIAGPTASGKSAAALAAAETFNGVVINADSMQVYRDLRILTARPSAEDEARVPHALYGHRDGALAYSAGKWLEEVSAEISNARNESRTPVITGGTGLYFKALLEGLSPIPDIPEDIRTRWRKEAAGKTGPELHEILNARDPAMAVRLRASDPQRIVRALEVIDATGKSLAEWQEQPGEPLLDEERVIRCFIKTPREDLYERIDARFDAMIAQGTLDEVAALAERALDSSLPVMRALGVQPLIAHIHGEMSLEAAAERVKTDSRRYAKRQLTWANRNMISWNRIKLKDSERFWRDIFANIDD